MSTAFTQKSPISKNSTKISKADSKSENLVKIFFSEVGLTNASTDEILEYIISNLPKQQESYYIVTPNPEILLYANTHPEFKSILNDAKIALTDGMQLFRGARMAGIPLKERIIGTDFMEKLCEKVAKRPVTIGFLGGRDNIAEKTAECLREKFPGLNVVFSQAEWDEEKSHPDIDILFVAYGFPKQEKWMAKHSGKIRVKVMMGVGGAFDQIVHPFLRPPKLIHQLGLGWLYRLVREPWRLKGQVKLIQFAGLVLQEKMKRS